MTLIRNTLSKTKNQEEYKFETLFNLYYTGLIVYANHFTGQTETSEDIVHDVFISLWEKRKSLVLESSKAYLFSSVRNRCLNYLSQLKVRDNYQERILQKGDITGLLTWEYYVESELQEHIEKAIGQLPPQCQKIFIMSRFENKNTTQIAEELQISPRTVEKHIETALKKLRQELSEYLPAGILLWLLY